MKRTAHALVLATVFAATPAIQAQPTDAEKAAMRQACRGDFTSLCAGVPAGGAAAFDCLRIILRSFHPVARPRCSHC